MPTPHQANGSVGDVFSWADLSAWHPNTGWLAMVGALAAGYLAAVILAAPVPI